VDSGPIFAQKRVSFVPEQDTFEQSHRILRSEIEALFMHHSEDIFLGRLKPAPQTGQGSIHKKKDLPAAFGGWHKVIGPEIARLKALTNQ
jgi:methionyl-tRNA formyltransferase